MAVNQNQSNEIKVFCISETGLTPDAILCYILAVTQYSNRIMIACVFIKFLKRVV